MARGPRGIYQEIHDLFTFINIFLVVVIIFLVINVSVLPSEVEAAEIKSLKNSSGGSSKWHNCPDGWTLYNQQCYKLTSALLTWAQAQALCSSYGGNLVKISSQCEQDFVSEFVSEQLVKSTTDVLKTKASTNVADTPGVAAWIGFVHLPGRSYQWSDGQPGVEQAGFWALDGLQASHVAAAASSKLCCNMRQTTSSKNLRWHLTDCDSRHASVCMLAPCEEHSVRCADGSKCVGRAWLCDGHKDCQDGSDEMACNNKDLTASTLSSISSLSSSPSLSSPSSPQCGAMLRENSGSLQSPDYPEDYPPYSDCVWKIEAMPPKILEITVENLTVEEMYDSLRIYEGMEISDKTLIASLDGQVAHKMFRSTTSFVTVHFVSDHSVQLSGFNISWDSVEPDANSCGGKLLGKNEESLLIFPRPDYHAFSHLSSQRTCEWTISSPQVKGLLSLQFKNLTLQASDSLSIHDGQNSDSPILCHINSSHVACPPTESQLSYGGVAVPSHTTPPAIVSSTQHLFIHAAINSGSSSRFVISYKTGCDVLISSSPAIVMSPGYTSSHYPNNLNCSWTVKRDDEGRQFTLVFLPTFLTEAGKDYVQVYSSESQHPSSLMTEVSGPLLPHQAGISSVHGFFLKFVSDSTVNRGRWAALISYDCDYLSVLPPMVLNTTGTRFGTTVQFSCSPGYVLDGPAHSVCWMGGKWAPAQIPKCTEISCGSPPVPDQAYLTRVTGLTYGSHAHYQCFYGHTMIGNSVSTCGDKGWEGVPRCEVTTCPKEPPPAGGTARAEDIRFGTLREYFCMPATQLVGSKFSHCDLSGQWTDPVPTCEVPHCPALYGILNGQLSETESISVGRSVQVSCNAGYRLTGHQVLTCQGSSHYDHSLPTCVDVDECSEPNSCGPHQCQNYPGSYSCFCNVGYQHPVNSSHSCIEISECEDNNGGCSHRCVNLPGNYRCECPTQYRLHNGPFEVVGNVSLIPGKTCIATCKSLVVGGGATVIYDLKSLSSGQYLEGTKAVVKCPAGHHASGTTTMSCIVGGEWSAPVPGCMGESVCEKPLNISNGQVFYISTTLASSVNYRCNLGYDLRGPWVRFCLETVDKVSGSVQVRWSGTEPSCVAVECPTPVPPLDGSVHYTSTSLGSLAVYRCQCGYQLVNHSVSRCGLDGKWSQHAPVCQARGCTHPGIPAYARITEHQTGFPVGSNVSFQCEKPGYQISSQEPLKCLPLFETHVSIIAPFKSLTLTGQFVPLGRLTMGADCGVTYIDSLREIVKDWMKNAIQACQKLEVNVDIVNIHVTQNVSSVLSTIWKLQLASHNTTATCLCDQELSDSLRAIKNSSPVNRDDISVNSSCPVVSLRPGSDLQVTQHWQCGPGLRLVGGEEQCGSPQCMEDCIADGVETLDPSLFTAMSQNPPLLQHRMLATGEESWTISTAETIYEPATTTATAASTSLVMTTQSTRQFTTIKTTATERPTTTAADTTSSATTTTTATTTIPALVPMKEKLQGVLSTSVSPTWTSSTARSVAMSNYLTSVSATTGSTHTKSESLPTTPTASPVKLTSITTTTLSPVTTAATTSTTTTPDFGNSDLDFFNSKKDELWREGANGSERITDANDFNRKHNDGPSKPTTNCTAAQLQKNNTGKFSGPEKSNRWPGGHGQFRDELNMSDCLTTHTLEKQEITVVQGPSVPTLDLTSPVFSVEVHDHMSGGFDNISCIDAVHININTKVNELLREFGNEMGKQVCRDAPDSSLELAAGNIRFKGTRARIYIRFSIAYSTSSKVSVESCGSEFQSFTASHLPKKFENVEREVPSSECKFVNYSRHDFKLSNIGWSCHNGYSMDESLFQCIHTPAEANHLTSDVTSATTATMTSTTHTPVLTVPRLSMSFTGAFTTNQPQYKVDMHCVDEYRAGLIQALTQLEPYLQSRFYLCSNIYISINRNVTVSLSRQRIIIEAGVHLIPLEDNINFGAMSKCAKFLSLQFREPSQHLSSVTLSRELLPTCPPITLSPYGLRSDINQIQFYCTQGYFYNDANFKCIEESQPLYATGIELVLTGTFEGIACVNIVRETSDQLVLEVIRGIQKNIAAVNLCSDTKDIVLLNGQGSLSMQQLGVTVSIPLTLVSLRGSQSDSVHCANQLFPHLSTALSQPISTMVNTLSHKCGASILVPGDYTVAYTRWECFPHLVYNALTHQCDPVTSQVPDTRTKGLSISHRQRRDVTIAPLGPQWNAPTPVCIDTEPPIFDTCSDTPIIITLGNLGSTHVSITLPSVSDNSGVKPQVTFTPSNFRLPYRFTKNTTVVMEATDNSGNKAKCFINIIVYDQIPPTISCPSQLFTVVDETAQEYARITYKDATIVAADNNGDVTVIYNPREGSVVRANDVFQVTVIAVDSSQNVANCFFLAKVEAPGCPEWSLPFPVGGYKKCSHAGISMKGLACAVSCPSGMGFAVKPPEQYVCANKGQWQPHNRVPQCVEGSFPHYEVHLLFNLTYSGNITEECLKPAITVVEDSIKPRLKVACQAALDHLTMTDIHSVGSFVRTISTTTVTIKIKFTIETSPSSLAKTSPTQWCGLRLLRNLEFNDTLDVNCGQITLTTPIHASGNDMCPEGKTLNSGFCLTCPPGSYWSNSTCTECPQGSYQRSAGAFSCVECGPGRSTPYSGARYNEECIAECGANEFSFNGIEPCIPCPPGTYQPDRGSTGCEKCVPNDKGKYRSPYCKELCPAGQFSSTGTSPCQLCPLNYYSTGVGSTTCTECPDGQVTKKEGSHNLSHCKAFDPCQDNPCKSKGECQPYGREFVCQCAPGFTGLTCEERVDSCASQPCLHNSTCENRGSGFKCQCQTGFTGPTCSTVRDACESDTCVHGLCVNSPTGYQCLCHSGFEGRRCQQPKDNCAGVICHNDGVCVDLVDGYLCSCRVGFTGTFCEVDVDDCKEHYCLNGGSCQDHVNFYTCSCPPGFTGELCESNVDDCVDSPCLNGGLCQDSISSFTCLCKAGYTGSRCEKEIDACESKPCLNDGVCSPNRNTLAGFQCRCKNGYAGVRCETNKDDCQPMRCNANGTRMCEDAVAGHRCHCLPGWTGPLCSELKDPCSTQPCDNGGKCLSNGLTFTCQCTDRYAGPTCSKTVSACHSQPCQNKGQCMDSGYNFRCECRPGFNGSLCEHNIDECVTQPCLNGGKCLDGVNWFTCRCPRGFAGRLCEVDIDECLSQPCMHNSSCQQLDGRFLCDCSPGYTGSLCETEINECDSDPCYNGGRCLDKIGGFYCDCPQGFSGSLCKETKRGCLASIVCKNGGTCRRTGDKDMCVCSPYYSGPDCGKEKSPNFDLVFDEEDRGASLPPVIQLGNLSEMTLCLWVKVDDESMDGTFLSLMCGDGSPVINISGSHAASPVFAYNEISVLTNDGDWHHMCSVLTQTVWKLYVDGEELLKGNSQKWKLSSSLKLTLGQPAQNKDDDEDFRGQLHGVNIYSYALDGGEIANMSQQCHLDLSGGDIFDWVIADSYLNGDVQVVRPSLCGQKSCSMGSGGGQCTFHKDKIPPEVIQCPDIIVVTNDKSPVPVMWVEPEFEDNVGVVSIKQNFRSGQTFSHGQYLVTYIAYDEGNNSAECTFKIFVRRFACVDPPPPVSGARVCGEWHHGRYCIPSCMDKFHFVTPVPPFYRCGREGQWDPDNGDPFAFPACARTHPPAHTIFGGISFEGPACTDTFKQELRAKLVRILTQLDNVLGLCGPDVACNYMQGLNIECSADQDTRRKRATDGAPGMYRVVMDINVSNSLHINPTLRGSVPGEIIHAIKHDQNGTKYFTLTSDDLHLTPHCREGQMLVDTVDPQCLDCPAGHYMKDKTTCVPCPHGWYSEKPLQTSCVQCPHGLTTYAERAISARVCYTICDPGSYFDLSRLVCQLCPLGQYQDKAGQSNCNSCPVGLTTQNKGAKSSSQCADLCQEGEELGASGECVACPVGSYKTGQAGSGDPCIPCPFGWTTERKGATVESQCSVVKCEKGYFQKPEDLSCHPCPVGTFQHQRGASSCEPCGVGLTTKQEGATSKSLCIKGKVDECALKIFKCGPRSECVDLEEGYMCQCTYGKTNNGECVDPCEFYCGQLRLCGEEGDVGDVSGCHCGIEMCRDDSSRAQVYKTLVIVSISVTCVSTLVLMVIVLVCIYRRNQQKNQHKHVRIYREEREMVSFTNEAFDTISTQVGMNQGSRSHQVPTRMATRWHSRSFTSSVGQCGTDIESTDL